MINFNIINNWNTYTKKITPTYQILSEEVDYLNDKILNNINLLDFYNLFDINDKNILKECTIYKGKYTNDSNIGYVYIIENILLNKKYIGRTINPISRLTNHIRKSSNYNLSIDLIKYGLYNFNYTSYLIENYK